MPTGKTLTPEQQKLLLHLSKQGCNPSQIAAQMHLSASYVRCLLKQLRNPINVKENVLLSTKEVEILNLVKSGYLHKQIAHRLGKRESTVKNQAHLILLKLSAYTLTHAVCIAIKLGIINLDDLTLEVTSEEKTEAT